MDLTTLQARTAKFAGDPDQVRYSAGYLNAINDSQKQFVLDTNALYKNKSWDSSESAVGHYDLPTDFIIDNYVTYNGIAITSISRNTLYQLYPAIDYLPVIGTPLVYMINTNEDFKKMTVIPYQPAESGVTIIMGYVALPADVSAGSDVIFNSSTLMTQFHLGVAAFAAWLLLQSEAITPEIQAKMRELLKIYTDAVNVAIEKFGNTKSERVRIRPQR